MDGIIANLQGICDLADKYGAMVMVDDSHASGFVGKHGKGSTEHCGVMGRVDMITGTFGKAWAALPAASPPASGKSLTSCASGAAPISSPTPWLPPWLPAR